MTSKEDLLVRAIILELAEFLTGGVCDLCGRSESFHISRKSKKAVFDKGMSFVIHHWKYKKKNGVIVEKIHSDFTKLNSKGKLVPDRLAYHKYLKPIVLKEPRRFRVLHNKCHYALEQVVRWSPANRKKLFKLADETYKNNYA